MQAIHASVRGQYRDILEGPGGNLIQDRGLGLEHHRERVPYPVGRVRE